MPTGTIYTRQNNTWKRPGRSDIGPTTYRVAGGLVCVDPTKLVNVSASGVDHIVAKVPWSSIEATQGTYDWSVVDNILSTYSSAKITLRIQAGEVCPAWLKTATGTVSVFLASRPGQNADVCHWWEELAMASWQNMISAAGVKYDLNSRVVMVSADLPMVVYSEPFILGNDGPSGIRLFNAGLNQTTQGACIIRCVNDTATAFPNTLIELATHVDWQNAISTGISHSWPDGRDLLYSLAMSHGKHLAFSDYGLGLVDTAAAHPTTGTITTETDQYAWMNIRANGGSAPWAGPVFYQLTVGTEVQNQATYQTAAQNALDLGGQMVETAGWGLLSSALLTSFDTSFKAKAATW